ncbi:group I intron endonuclease [Clostridium baratii]|uniref:GIY-YIG nuclease family protein n=1 Tax=Clostridium baratii TaxID=1561 RepID=UPI0006C10231|nr:GIY-YIG nuclease family protein [Clostridium baratii]CUP04762.1 group I intron endonuclease [Clostridium baratii]
MKYNLRNIAEVEELKQVKGIIYKITNEITQKVYIGETLKSFNERYSNIFTSHNKLLQADIYDYGISNFTVELLEKNILDDELLRELEELYIKRYKKNTYNINYNKSIICLNDLEVFSTVKECVNYYNLSISNLYAHLLGYRNYSQVKGKKFMYLCEYEK